MLMDDIRKNDFGRRQKSAVEKWARAGNTASKLSEVI